MKLKHWYEVYCKIDERLVALVYGAVELNSFINKWKKLGLTAEDFEIVQKGV